MSARRAVLADDPPGIRESLAARGRDGDFAVAQVGDHAAAFERGHALRPVAAEGRPS